MCLGFPPCGDPTGGGCDDAEGGPGGAVVGVVMAAAAAVLVAGCAREPEPLVVQGRAVSMRYDPNRVAGLPVNDGPSGPRTAPPSAAGSVRNTDDGAPIVSQRWPSGHRGLLAAALPETLPGSFSPVSGLVSVDPGQHTECAGQIRGFSFNAAYCRRRGDVITGTGPGCCRSRRSSLASWRSTGYWPEYGHALQRKGRLGRRQHPELVSEQQADCFAGVYLRWVAEGDSSRFELNTTEALDKVLAGAIAIRDHRTSIRSACFPWRPRTAPLWIGYQRSSRDSTSAPLAAPGSPWPTSGNAAATSRQLVRSGEHPKQHDH